MLHIIWTRFPSRQGEFATQTWPQMIGEEFDFGTFSKLCAITEDKEVKLDISTGPRWPTVNEVSILSSARLVVRTSRCGRENRSSILRHCNSPIKAK
jgi:hypothetical protein